MLRYPKLPDGKVLDILSVFMDELKAWKKTPVEGSQINKNGRLVYTKYFIEHFELAPISLDGPVPKEGVVEQYIVDAKQADYIIQAKALETALAKNHH